MHTLEGGKNAFYDRKDIYESGKKVINVHLEKRENKDYLVFGFEEARSMS